MAEEVVAEVGITTKGGEGDGRIGNKVKDIKGTAAGSDNNNKRRHPKKFNKEPLTNPAASRL